MQPTLLRHAADLAERGVACALATVVSARGSVPGKPGATMLVTVDGTSRGTVGGAGLEEAVKRLCVEALQRGEGGVHRFDLARWKKEGLDSLCGGTVEVAITLVRAVPHLLLVGGGHCSQALARVCDVLDWNYSVVDSRAAFAMPELFPHAQAVTHADPAAHVAGLDDVARYSHCYLLGHSHHEDAEALLALIARGFPGVIGVIGSRSKLHAFGERAAARGFGIDGVRSDSEGPNVPAGTWRVRCPIGVDVGARSPAEIAVAVAAEVIRDVQRPALRPSPPAEPFALRPSPSAPHASPPGGDPA